MAGQGEPPYKCASPTPCACATLQSTACLLQHRGYQPRRRVCKHAEDGGFLAINQFLQSTGPSNVFACGDVATSVTHPRPKAGVFAVRQGPPLAENLRRFVTGQPLKPFVPQTEFLGLISLGDKVAVATRGALAFQGQWLWGLKDRIDQQFMHKFGSNLPKMTVDAGMFAPLVLPVPLFCWRMLRQALSSASNCAAVTHRWASVQSSRLC